MEIKRLQDPRQAVIVIHGIGEQRPMATIRAFLEGTGRQRPFYNRPHQIRSNNLELRRFSTREPGFGDKTDYFELYWAHHFEDGNIRDTLKWAGKNIFRKLPAEDDQLRKPVTLLRGLVLLIFALTLSVGVTLWLGRAAEIWLWVAGIVGLLLFCVLMRAASFLTSVLSDAARYFTPEPGNIKARNAIRAEGIALLTALHNEGFYERIVIVGHSLGSVIGLDILRLAWEDLRHPDPASTEASNLAANFTGLVTSLPDQLNPEEMLAWQQAQHQLWKESRVRGMRWLVTDFITLGSPLSHASFLLYENEGEFSERLVEREYPACPPDTDRGIFYPGRYVLDDGNPSDALVAHHAAPFAVTRWSNAYFPVRGWLQGDAIGGPIAPEFGRGIRDIPVRVQSRKLTSWSGSLLAAHGKYWIRQADPDYLQSDNHEVEKTRRELNAESGTRVAHVVLEELLQLETWKDSSPDSPLTRDVSAGYTPGSGATTDALAENLVPRRITDIQSPLA